MTEELRQVQARAKSMGLVIEVLALPSRVPSEAETVLELWEAGELVARCDDVAEVRELLFARG